MKVKYLGGATEDQIRWGNNDDPRGLLKAGVVYEVCGKDVHSWHAKYELVEFPGKWFNSVHFEKVKE